MNVMWTKDAVHKLITMWATSTPDEIAEVLGVSRKNVNYMAMVLRKKGVNIPRKRLNGTFHVMIDEFLAEFPQYKK